MIYKNIFAVLCLVLAGCATSKNPEAPNGGPPSDLPKQLRGRQVIVTLRWDRPERWAQIGRELARRYALEPAGEFPLRSIQVQCLVYRPAANQTLEAALQQLRADPDVESAQLNLVFAGLKAGHADPYAGLVYGAQQIHADAAHKISTGKGVKIAVIDTGVDKDHPDLRGRITKTANFVEGGEQSFAHDRHGTAVAGVIAARADDGVGIFGIAPDAELLAEKACWYHSTNDAKALCSSWTLAKAIDFATNSGVNLINLSLAGPPDELLRRLVDKAHSLGIIVVAATAETGTTPGFPAELDYVLAVVASDTQRHIANHAWTKPGPVLAAPGIEILTTAPQEGYDFASGSSLAAAHVSGAIALLLQQRPNLSAEEVRKLLEATANSPIDVCAALNRLLAKTTCS